MTELGGQINIGKEKLETVREIATQHDVTVHSKTMPILSSFSLKVGLGQVQIKPGQPVFRLIKHTLVLPYYAGLGMSWTVQSESNPHPIIVTFSSSNRFGLGYT